ARGHLALSGRSSVAALKISEPHTTTSGQNRREMLILISAFCLGTKGSKKAKNNLTPRGGLKLLPLNTAPGRLSSDRNYSVGLSLLIEIYITAVLVSGRF